MARWKLIAPHYIPVPGAEWEYRELDRKTGKQVTRKFPVPSLLDPRDPGDWNHSVRSHTGEVIDGEIIVCHIGKGQPQDIEFTGDPTPDMIPLDDEAKAISAAFADRWRHPIDELSPTYGQSLTAELEAKMAQLPAAAGTQTEGMTELLGAMTKMMEQNQLILSALIADKAPKADAASVRRQ